MSSDSEDYAEYGIGLEQLDEESLPRKKPFSLGEQIATDEHGRRRFHGAFTGGFSAGFFNSVGSLEGWTPSNFKSSRSEKAAIKSQKPEDFMDDEDMGEFGIAPKVLRATKDFNSSQKRERTHHTSEGPIPGEPVLRQLLQPVRETIGVKLLKQMGWKPGQGVGPRVTKKEKKQMKKEYSKAAIKVYGCSLPEQQTVVHQESSSEDEDVEASLTFAPEDIPVFVCKPKDNFFGLGYSGLDRRPVLSSHINLFAPSTLKMKEKKKNVSISGQAFGVGVLEEDDEDIYAQEDMSQYDFTMDSATSKNSRQSRFSEKPPLANYAGDVLEGFVLTLKQFSRKKHFPPPSLPQGYQPLHSTRISRFEPTSVEETKIKGLQRHNLTATERLQILSEPQQNSVAKNTDTNSLEEERKMLKVEALKITENASTSSALGCSYTFRPFAGHPEKQERYEKFLALSKLGQKEKLSYLQPLTMTEWEKERERVEFEQAAKLYRPLSGQMSDRFVSATHSDDHSLPEKPTETDSDQKAAAKIKMFGKLTREETDWRPCSLLCKRFNIPELYPGQGDISLSTKKKPTFSVFDFLEDSVKPKIQAVPENEEKTENKHEEGEKNDVEVSKLSVCEDKTEEQDIEEVKTSKDTSLEFPDPPAKIDLYKAIFLSSSSSSEDSESDDNEDKAVLPSSSNTTTPQPNTSTTPQPNTSTTPQPNISTTPQPNTSTMPQPNKTAAPAPKTNINLSPPRGVFANLDLDAIMSRRKDRTVEQLPASRDSTCSESSVSAAAKETLPQSDNMYGPSLPIAATPSVQDKVEKPKPLTSVVAIPNAVWVEKTKESHKTKHHKKHKKSSKHKKHKSKTKHKKKKH